MKTKEKEVKKVKTTKTPEKSIPKKETKVAVAVVVETPVASIPEVPIETPEVVVEKVETKVPETFVEKMIFGFTPKSVPNDLFFILKVIISWKLLVVVYSTAEC